MKDNVKATVRQILSNYLEINHLRRTPERYAVLDAVYDIPGRFSLAELGLKLEERNFRVSRATLYNTMRLFTTLRLVLLHRAGKKTAYEASFASSSYCYQVCTMCGKQTEVKSAALSAAVEQTRFKRFHRDCFVAYVYGVCSTCLARQTRKLRQMEQRNTKKNKNKK